ncbi:cytochrome c biogenesis protein CcmG/thiol:disulfide interchange protein DsbE [Mesocricetibacter intestinalis]|uniref:Cytochrome c biogenesis protein CcmG/thiol:disulfide interchange protein DsbE n=1 Tax=Mesocricetibacter intestinalis TaxID=1521930 RepID=A0A4R6V812_9PAST|nr:DsbE family thiol:disulfide interchange protein [Mesocricetibacter intestinalis]TDQ57862.1 cytochrome c biogenesis protein CcmG/thiol:disulfide interchange protein DsbE [Mesocricetibacter intestinalis]
MKKKLLFFTPLILAVGIGILLFDLLRASAPSGQKSLPDFYLQDLFEPERVISRKDLPSQPYLLNVWGSWCYYCRFEHPLLMEIAAQGVNIVGVAYRDSRKGALEMLNKSGNPFSLVIDDSKGSLAPALGIEGAPETYVIDGQGVIRYRYSGAMDERIWRDVLKPELDKLRK